MANVFIEETTLTAIGNAIRSKTGTEDLMLPSDMPAAIDGISVGGGGSDGSYDEGYSDALTDEYNRFWDEYQSNGKRTNYRVAFGGTGWSKNCIEQYKYPLCPNNKNINGYFIFAYNTSIDDLTEILKKDDKLCFSNSEYAFTNCTNLTHLGKVYIDNYRASTFTGCSKLSVIDELTIDSTTGSSPFGSNTNLTYIKFGNKDTLSIPINLSSASGATTIVIPEDVYDEKGNLIYSAGEEVSETGILYYPTISTLITALKPNAGKTLTLGNNKSKLIQTPEQDDIITITQTKGWTLV